MSPAAKTKKSGKPSADAEEQDVKTPGTEIVSSVPFLRIITGSYEHNLLSIALSTPQGKPLFTPIFHFSPHTEPIYCLAASSRYLVSGSKDCLMKIYDLSKRKAVGQLMHHDGPVTALSFFKDKWLLSGAKDGQICIWRTSDWSLLGDMKGKHHKGEVSDIAIHPSGKIALTVGQDNSMILWNLMTARQAERIKLGRNSAIRVCWCTAGEQYVVAYDRKLSIYNVSSSEPVKEVRIKSKIHHMRVCTVGDEEYAVTSHDDGVIRFTPTKDLLDTTLNDEDTKPAFELRGHATRVKYFAIMNDSVVTNKLFLSSVSTDGKIVVWDLAQRDQIAVYDSGERLMCCVMVPDSIERQDLKSAGEKRDAHESESDDSSESDDDDDENLADFREQTKKKPKVTVDLEEN